MSFQVIGALITSLARTEMYKAMMACEKADIELYYSDTGCDLFKLQALI